mgnify:CR=1 FL=1
MEDDLEDLNPERNPLKRQETQLRRISEDLQLRQGLTESEKTDQARAALIAGERRLAEYSQVGQRSFISRSTVGSIEDEELKARMTGNFGPQQKREDHMGDSLDQLNDKLAKLMEMVHIKAIELGH